MRFEPSEEAMYRLMDRKDRVLFFISLFGMAGCGIVLMSALGRNWQGSLAAMLLTVTVLAVLGIWYRSLYQRILPLSGCYLEIQGDYFAVCQPDRKKRYTTARLYFDEIVTLIRERNGGFFICVKDQAEKSRAYCGKVLFTPWFLVEAFGYGKGEIEAVYQEIKKRISSQAEVYEP